MLKKVPLHTATSRLASGSIHQQEFATLVKDNESLIQRMQVQEKTNLNPHQGCVNTICWNHRGTHILSGSDDQHLAVTDAFNRTVTHKFLTPHKNNIYSARFLQCDDTKIVSGCGGGRVLHLDIDTYVDAGSFNIFDCHKVSVYEVIPLPTDQSTFLTSSADGTIRLFDLRQTSHCFHEDDDHTGCSSHVLCKRQGSVFSMDVNPARPWELAAGCSDSSVRIFDRRMMSSEEPTSASDQLRILHQFCPGHLRGEWRNVTSVQYSPDGEELLTSYSGDFVYLYNTRQVLTEKEETAENDRPSPHPASPDTPYRQLKLRGDWSDTGPQNIREAEGRVAGLSEFQSPGNTPLLQRLTGLLNGLINSSGEREDQEEGQENPEEARAEESQVEPDSGTDPAEGSSQAAGHSQHGQASPGNSRAEASHEPCPACRLLRQQEVPQHSMSVEHYRELQEYMMSPREKAAREAVKHIAGCKAAVSGSTAASQAAASSHKKDESQSASVTPDSGGKRPANQHVPISTENQMSDNRSRPSTSDTLPSAAGRHGNQPTTSGYRQTVVTPIKNQPGATVTSGNQPFAAATPVSQPFAASASENQPTAAVRGVNQSRASNTEGNQPDARVSIETERNPGTSNEVTLTSTLPSRSQPNTSTSSINRLSSAVSNRNQPSSATGNTNEPGSAASNTNEPETASGGISSPPQAETHMSIRQLPYNPAITPGLQAYVPDITAGATRGRLVTSADVQSAARRIQNIWRNRRRTGPPQPLPSEMLPDLDRDKRIDWINPLKAKQFYRGHRNCRTVIKEACFWGSNYVMSGSDCGHIFIWDKNTAELKMLMEGDAHVVNCLKPHPNLPILACSGVDYNIKLFTPSSQAAAFDRTWADKVTSYNEEMLPRLRGTITLPAMFVFHLMAIRARRVNEQREASQRVVSHAERWLEYEEGEEEDEEEEQERLRGRNRFNSN